MKNTKPSLYDIDFLKYEERIGEFVYLKFTSALSPLENYEGKAKLLSHNDVSCLFSNGQKVFTIYVNECINNKAKSFDHEVGDTLEIYKISKTIKKHQKLTK